MTTPAVQVRTLPPDALRDDVLALLEGPSDPFSRSGRPAHVTASAVVLSEGADDVLLVRHAKLGLWLHPGGHVEPGDASLAAAARREAVEETGVTDLRPVGGPLGLHRHAAPCAPPGEAEHLDVRFVLVAPRSAALLVSQESTGLRWFPVDGLPADSVPELALLVASAVARRRAVGQRPGSALLVPAPTPGAAGRARARSR